MREPLEMLRHGARMPAKKELIAIEEEIVRELDEMRALIKGVADHILLDDTTPRFARISLSQVLERGLPRLRDEADTDKDIDLRYERTMPALLMNGDADLLISVFRNIICNAIEHTPEYGVITVQVQEIERWARVTISDHGPGIPEQSLRWLFAPGFRIGSEQRFKLDGRGYGSPFLLVP